MADTFEAIGSLWRRWDPHVHLPGTLLNDQFKGASMEDALDILASRDPQIEVVGVTDYFTTATYRRALQAHSAGAGAGIRMLFPNVELRLDNATSSNHGVNVHLMCAPDDVDGLDRFLGSLEFTWREQIYRADSQGLVQLGRDFRGEPSLDEGAALKLGATQFKVNFESLRRSIRTDRWARASLLIGLAGGQGDGSSGLRAADGAFQARRQSIEAFADVVFSSSPNQVDFWIGRGRASVNDLRRIYGGPKLCIHGSDAHDIASLGVPAEDRLCWLKGDPSFETLRLARLTPSSRSHIGPESPSQGFSHGRVVSVGVPSGTWFANQDVPVNPGLVAIIGARGSGKTAFADLIAAGAGSDEPFVNPASFVRRAERLLRTSTVEVTWSHGDTTQCAFVNGAPQDAIVRPVRYLSQQFVERLCAADGVSDELLNEIERVVFEAWPVDQRQGAHDFAELLELRLGSARQRQAAELDAVLSLSERITDARLLRSSLPGKGRQRDAQQVALSQLASKTLELTRSADQRSAARLGEVNDALHARQLEAQRVDRRRASLSALQRLVGSARATAFPQYTEKIRTDNEAAGLTDGEWEAFRIDFTGDVDGALTRALGVAVDELTAITGSAPEGDVSFDSLTADDLCHLTVSELSREAERVRELVGLDESRAKQLKTLTDKAGELRARLAALDREIDEAKSVDDADLVARRLGHYRAYFDALLEEEAELKQLYAPLANLLAAFGRSTQKLQFVVRRTVDVRRWAFAGEALLDLRREGRFRGEGGLARVAVAELLTPWESGDAAAAADAIHNFVQKYSDDLRKHRLVRTDDVEAIASWNRSISKWLYSTDHIRLRYSLEYDGLSIERLSPGSRGIVLLLLYLAVDQEETDPLIIDQPEENLDPESVYSELVDLFRSASRRRQIIMVTHNANLVVNTDVDQVIVAHCGSLAEGRLPEFRYDSGGLESPAIRRAVCEVLEGGAEAFRQRARRLGLDEAVTGSLSETGDNTEATD